MRFSQFLSHDLPLMDVIIREAVAFPKEDHQIFTEGFHWRFERGGVGKRCFSMRFDLATATGVWLWSSDLISISE